jgi:hypothetical protein
MVPPDRHQPGRHLEDLLLDGRSTHLGVPTGRYTSAGTIGCQGLTQSVMGATPGPRADTT